MAIQGGWLVLNHAKYRQMLRDQERKEYKADWIRERRNLSPERSHSSGSSEPPAQFPYGAGSFKDELTKNYFNSEWVPYRKCVGKKPKDWNRMFTKQAEWLSKFNFHMAKEIIDQSIRNNWQGLFDLKGEKAFGRQMSVFEIDKRLEAIRDEINKIFRKNGNKRVEGDGIDELKARKAELEKQRL
jgi:hypothetical protein